MICAKKNAFIYACMYAKRMLACIYFYCVAVSNSGGMESKSIHVYYSKVWLAPA